MYGLCMFKFMLFMFHMLPSESVFKWPMQCVRGLQPVEGEKSEVSGWPNGSYFLFARNMAKCLLTTFVLMSCLDCVQNKRHWIETIWDNMR